MLELTANGSWSGVFNDLPKTDGSGNPIIYTVKEDPVKGYVSDIIAKNIDGGDYHYPDPYTGDEPDTSVKQTAKVKVSLPGGGRSDIWSIQPGLRTDYIPASHIVFNTNAINYRNAELHEFDKHGSEVTNSEDRMFVRRNNYWVAFVPGENCRLVNGMYRPDHYFTIKYKNAVTILDGTVNGTHKDITIRFDVRELKPYTDKEWFRTVEDAAGLWIGSGSGSEYGRGSMDMDITARIEDIDGGTALLNFSDIDIKGEPYNETVVLYKDTFNKTVYTVPLFGTTDTRTTKTLFRVNPAMDNWFYGRAMYEDTGTMQSGFVAEGNMGTDGILEMKWQGPQGVATRFFTEIAPFRWKTTIEESVMPNHGGTISETLVTGERLNAHEWRYRDYGEARLITVKPSADYHVRYLKIDGQDIDLEMLGNNKTLNVTSGWTGMGNRGSDTVRFYQREDGAVDVYLPKQFFASTEDQVMARADHWVDAGFAPNGTVTNYEIVNTPETSVRGTKTWDPVPENANESNRNLVLNLYQNGELFIYDRESQLTWDGSTYTISGLPMYTDKGDAAVYTVKEEPVAGYVTTIDNNNNITNSMERTTSVTGTKIWVDGGRSHNNEKEIRLTLLRSVNEGEPEVVRDVVPVWNGSDYVFENLPKYDENFHEYLYTVEESLTDEVELQDDESYIMTIADAAGYDLKNILARSVEVKKVWEDEGDLHGLRPEKIGVVLLANGEKAAEAELTADGGWTHTFKDLPVYDDEGDIITYKAEEVKVEGYTSSVSGSAKDGFIITNKYVPVKINISAAKKWDDGENKDGIRPEKITLHLMADGRRIDSAVLSNENGWRTEFSGLPEYDGKRQIVYKIYEDKVNGYTSAVTGDASDGFIITNIHKPGTSDNSDGRRGSGKPGTGDSGSAALWIWLMTAGLTALTGMSFYRRKKGRARD